jgi:aryl-alcohol dehydrogenase-like predicted oxidoreductase
MTGSYGVRDDVESAATINAALDQGINLLDTSDAYGNGTNEEFVGKMVAERRADVLIATKFGNIRGPDGQRGIGVNGKPAYVLEACDKSLARLGVEAIDLYYQHRVDPEVPIEDTVGAMAKLVEQGKVRQLGLCEAGPETIRRAHATHPIAAVQMEYSLWTRDVEREVLPLLRDLGISLVAYAPLGRGFLTATVKSRDELVPGDRRHQHPRFQEGNLEANLHLLGPIEALAKAKGFTPAQVALAWLLTRGEDIIPIPGTKHRKYLQQNIDAVDIALDAAELEALSDAFPPDAATGLRYPEAQYVKLGL